MSRPLILSPAGSPEALQAALNAGADEIYFGLPTFNARGNAKNFTLDDAREAIRTCRLVGVKTNITLNTLVLDREIDDAIRLAYDAACLGADAFIVQDMGLARALKKAVPELVLHASTQCACHSVSGAKQLIEAGFERVVLARELDSEEIRKIASLGVETEIFVHGALCVCHSGLCLMSAVIGKRSGNRGLCAQPCRLPYSLSDEKPKNTYPLSLKDLSLSAHVPLLTELGVTSLKIEGRMKPPSYVAGTTRIWKSLVTENRPATRQENAYLEALFSRNGFTDGYFTGEYRVQNRAMYGVRTEADKRKTDELCTSEPKQVERKRMICMTADFCAGKAPEITVCDGNDPSLTAHVTAAFTAQPAESSPIDRETIAASLTKLGTTHFACSDIHIHLQNDVFLAKSQLNALRREAVEALEKKILDFPKPLLCAESLSQPHKSTGLRVGESKKSAAAPPIRLFPNTLAGLRTLIADWSGKTLESVCLPLTLFEQKRQNELEGILEVLRANALSFGVRMPRVIFSAEEPAACAALQRAADCGARYAVAENIGDLPLIRQSGLLLYAGASLNICNSQAVLYYRENGAADITLSPELTPPQMRDILRPSETSFSLIGAGRLELMVLESCVIRACGCCRKRADGEICDVLTDRLGLHFPIRAAHRFGTSYPCRSILLNSVPTNLAEKPAEIAKAGVATVCVYENPPAKRQSAHKDDLP